MERVGRDLRCWPFERDRFGVSRVPDRGKRAGAELALAESLGVHGRVAEVADLAAVLEGGPGARVCLAARELLDRPRQLQIRGAARRLVVADRRGPVAVSPAATPAALLARLQDRTGGEPAGEDARDGAADRHVASGGRWLVVTDVIRVAVAELPLVRGAPAAHRARGVACAGVVVPAAISTAGHPSWTTGADSGCSSSPIVARLPV